MKILGIYHRKDNDGFACAAVFKAYCKLNDIELELLGFDYSDSVGSIYNTIEACKPDEIIMADVTLKPSETVALYEHLTKFIKFIIIDHHQRAFDEHVKHIQSFETAKTTWSLYENNIENLNFRYFFNQSISACELLYQYLFETQKVPAIIETIGIYDTFRIDQNSAEWQLVRAFQYGSRLLDSDELINFVYNVILKNSTVIVNNLTEQGHALYAYEQKQNKLAEKSAFRIVNGSPFNAFDFNASDLKIGIINSCSIDPSNFNPQGVYDMVCVYFQKDDKTWKYSIRPGLSRNDIDYSELAMIFGGGGHKKACGFIHDSNIFEHSKTVEETLLF